MEALSLHFYCAFSFDQSSLTSKTMQSKISGHIWRRGTLAVKYYYDTALPFLFDCFLLAHPQQEGPKLADVRPKQMKINSI